MAIRIPIISDLIDKTVSKIQNSKLSKTLTDIPELQQLAMNISTAPKRLTVPNIMGVVEQEAFGAGREAAKRPVQLLNLLATGGSKISGLPNYQMNENALADVLMPYNTMSAFGRNTEKMLGREAPEAVGRGIYDLAEFYAGANAIKKIPAVAKGMEKLYRYTDPLIKSANPVVRTLGYGGANVVEGLPYTAMSQFKRTLKKDSALYDLLEGKKNVGDVSKDLLGELAFDQVIGMIAANAPGLLKNFGYSGAGRFKPQIQPEQVMKKLPEGFDMPFDPRGREIVNETPQEILDMLPAIEKLKPGDAMPQPEAKGLQKILKTILGGNSQGGYINFGADVDLGGGTKAAANLVDVNMGGAIKQVPANIGFDDFRKAGGSMDEWYAFKNPDKISKMMPRDYVTTTPEGAVVPKAMKVPVTDVQYKDLGEAENLIKKVAKGEGDPQDVLDHINAVSVDKGLSLKDKDARLRYIFKAIERATTNTETQIPALNKAYGQLADYFQVPIKPMDALESAGQYVAEPEIRIYQLVKRGASPKDAYMQTLKEFPGQRVNFQGAMQRLKGQFLLADLDNAVNAKDRTAVVKVAKAILNDPQYVDYVKAGGLRTSVKGLVPGVTDDADAKTLLKQLNNVEKQTGAVRIGTLLGQGEEPTPEGVNLIKTGKAQYEMPINTKEKRLQEIKAAEELTDTGEITNKQLKQLNKVLPTGSYSATPEAAAEKLFKQEQKMAAKEIQQEFKFTENEELGKVHKELTDALDGIGDAIKKNTMSPIAKSAGNLTDLNRYEVGNVNPVRNFQKIFGNNYEDFDRNIYEPYRQAKGAMVDDMKAGADDIWNNIVVKLGIKPKSALSGLVQDYGEGKITLDELKAKYPKDWERIVDADTYFRNFYDQWLDKVNEVRKMIYPNQPEKLIPRRQDYYRHFREFDTGFGGLKNIFDSPANISSNLSGVSDFTEPKTKFLSFAMRRMGSNEYERDAVSGALNYLKAASYASNIDPHISKFRGLAKELAEQTADGTKAAGKLNNSIEFLNDFANDLAGKTNPYDRSAQKLLGRKAFKVLDWLNSRIKSNTVLMNVGSSLSQFFNIPNGVADAGIKNSTVGFADFARQLGKELPDEPINKSVFLKERYSDEIFDKFDVSMTKDIKKFAKWMLTAPDNASSRIIWNAEYRKALSEGVPNPIKVADIATEKMVAGRGIGEMPLVQKARVTQMLAPFQVEVNNAWLVMKDFVSEKQFGKLITLAVANHLMNQGAKQIKGTPVVFDPIQAIYDVLFDEKPVGRIAGEVLQNLPVGQTIAEIYPEYGWNIPLVGKTPTRDEFFGGASPTRFGSSPLAIKGLQDPIFKILPPFGGYQLEKTLQGLGAFGEGEVKTPGTDKMKYPVEQNLPNFLRALLFGQYSFPEAREYFDSQSAPLGETQSDRVRRSPDRGAAYDRVMRQREREREKKKRDEEREKQRSNR